MHVIFSEATGDVTVYSYGIDENERVTGVLKTLHGMRKDTPFPLTHSCGAENMPKANLYGR